MPKYFVLDQNTGDPVEIYAPGDRSELSTVTISGTSQVSIINTPQVSVANTPQVTLSGVASSRAYNILSTVTVTIPSGQSLSSAVTLDDGIYAMGVVMDTAWTTANLTFQVSHDGNTYQSLYDSSGEISYPAAAGVSFSLTPAQFAQWKYLKFRSGTAATPVNQATTRTLRLVTRGV